MFIIIITLILCILIIIYYIYKDNLKFNAIKLKIIEEKIKSTLLNRKDLLADSEKKIKSILNTKKKIYDNLEINSNMSLIEMDSILTISVNELNLINNKYSELQDNEDFKKIYFSINETSDLLESYKKYYNDVAFKYNKLIKKFPISIINVIKRKKEKLFFD